MPGIFTTEILEQEKPSLLAYIDHFVLSKDLLTVISPLTNLILASEDRKSHTVESIHNLTCISCTKKEIENYQDKTEYLLICLNKKSNKRFIKTILNTFSTRKVKVILLTEIRQWQYFKDIISAVHKLPSSRILLLGDLFGHNISRNTSPVAEIIYKLKNAKQVIMADNELFPVFPVSSQDVVSVLYSVIFNTANKSKIQYLFYAYPQTFLSSIHLLKRIEPDLKVVFKDKKKNINRLPMLKDIEKDLKGLLQTDPEFVNGNLSGFEKSVKDILENEPSVSLNLKNTNPYGNNRTKIQNRTMLFLAATLGTSVIYFLLGYIIFIFSLILLNTATSSLEKNDFSKALQLTSVSSSIMPFTEFPVQVTISVMPFGKDRLESAYYLVKKATHLFSISASSLDKIQNMITSGEVSDLSEQITNLRYVYLESEKLRIENKIYDTQIKKVMGNSKINFITMLAVLPDILGDNEEKTYLILFQNNGELRPTGGFIGSLAELTIHNGQIKSFILRDVYEGDGQLKAHIEPHFMVRRHLQQHLYLRDSNFDPDFEKSAELAARIYRLETGKNISGVIAVNYEVLRRIIEKIGPLELVKYNTTLSSENAFDFIQNTIGSTFFPGSTQKKEILNAILDQLTLKISGNPNSLYSLFPVLLTSMQEKQILFAFEDSSIQNIFRQSGLSGSLEETRNYKENALPDVLSFNEANIGANKANISITRDVGYDISFLPTGIISRATLTIHNTGQKSGDYKSYLRVMAPTGSKLLSITIDGKRQKIVPAVTDYAVYEKPGFKFPEGLEVETSIQSKKTIWGFLTNVKKGTNQKIEVEYANGIMADFSNLQNYSFYYLKQPGTDNIPLSLTINYPENVTPVQFENAKINNFSATVQEKISTDKEIAITFINK